jgi:type VI secretion system protein ImpC
MHNDSSPFETSENSCPRLHIRYRLEFRRGVIEGELPFVIGVLTGIGGNLRPSGLRKRRWIQIDRDNFDGVLAATAPKSFFEVADLPGSGNARLRVELCFRSISDFSPEAVVEQCPALKELFIQRSRPSARGGTSPDVWWAGIAVEEIDGRISGLLDRILHAPGFRQLESTWRSLHYLVFQTEPSGNLKIRVLNANVEELRKDFRRAGEFDRSTIFKRIYDEEFDTYGGQPYGLLVGDYELGPEIADMQFLESMAAVAAASHAPFITAAGPRMFGCTDFSALQDARTLARKFDGEAYTRWRAFREMEDAGYAGLVLPRMLLRLPYVEHPIGGFRYNEGPEGGLWGNSAYALAAMAANTHARDGWPGRFGIGENRAPASVSRTHSGRSARNLPEVPLGADAQTQLAFLGFIPFVPGLDSDSPTFVDPSSCVRLIKDTDLQEGREKLRYVLAVSRFVHYLKCIVRDTRGCFSTVKDREEFLNSWIRRYVSPEADCGRQPAGRYPLQNAHVAVSSPPHFERGWYEAVVALTPRLPGQGTSGEVCLPAEITMRWFDA